jgi:hypothetical protein
VSDPFDIPYPDPEPEETRAMTTPTARTALLDLHVTLEAASNEAWKRVTADRDRAAYHSAADAWMRATTLDRVRSDYIEPALHALPKDTPESQLGPPTMPEVPLGFSWEYRVRCLGSWVVESHWTDDILDVMQVARTRNRQHPTPDCPGGHWIEARLVGEPRTILTVTAPDA